METCLILLTIISLTSASFKCNTSANSADVGSRSNSCSKALTALFTFETFPALFNGKRINLLCSTMANIMD